MVSLAASVVEFVEVKRQLKHLSVGLWCVLLDG